MARLQPYFPKSHGRKRVDDRRVLSGIIFVNRNGLGGAMRRGSLAPRTRPPTPRRGGATTAPPHPRSAPPTPTRPPHVHPPLAPPPSHTTPPPPPPPPPP